MLYICQASFSILICAKILASFRTNIDIISHCKTFYTLPLQHFCDIAQL